MHERSAVRPISRVLAHELTDGELDMVAGGSQCQIYTMVCSYDLDKCRDSPCCTAFCD